MSEIGNPSRLLPVRVVILPMAALTMVFAMILLAVIMSDQVKLLSPAPLLIAGALIYAATLVIMGRDGLARLRDLETFGNTDSLSNLPNRRALHRMIAKAFRSNHEVSLALIDLDGFKQVNDRYGHAVGDEVIAECANIIRSTCGDEAGCYRVGGDEFAAVMAGPAAGTILEGICRTLLAELSNPIQFGERHIVLGASIGLARSTSKERLSSSELLRRSDVAMYMSKRGGRGRCTWFNPTFDQRREAVRELEDEIRRGIVNDEFVLAYQPLVNADSREIVAVESLLRWNRPDGRNIGPNIFIPVAEESGLINTIGLWVLRQAISDALAWEDIILSVNISAAQLRNPEFPVLLGELLEESGFEPQRLELEITETCLVLDPVVAERTLDLIRGFGVHIALDDFGTGYASIGFLRQFRFEKLKLDRSLVAQAEEDDGSRAMMLSSIAMARALKMAVTAEGVETDEQADMVRLAGCDQMQGWLFYKAEPSDTIAQLLAEQRATQSPKVGSNTTIG